jgi:hypothetical protein
MRHGTPEKKHGGLEAADAKLFLLIGRGRATAALPDVRVMSWETA